MAARSIKLNLSEQASEDLRRVARELGLTETEVLRKGLLVMGLYSTIKKDDKGSLVLKQKDSPERELLIV